jgi:hypothetical protein
MAEFIFNGINGATGGYDLPPQSAQVMAKIARGVPLDMDEKKDIAIRRALDHQQVEHFGIREGADPTDISQSGWGVVFSKNLVSADLDALKEALDPLLKHRQEGATKTDERFYRECSGEFGYQSGASKNDFLKLFGRGPGPADPEKLPYYLLIVGSPHEIPYSFQYQLDVQYAVGRIHFDQLEDYYRYAVSVVEAETNGFNLARQAAFFSPANADDPATQMSAAELVSPLAKYLQEDQPDWQVQTLIEDQAHQADLDQLLHAPQAPALLFTASHGMSFPNGDPKQYPHQGALLCQDWPGPKGHRGPIPEEYYYSADNLAGDANLFGMLAVGQDLVTFESTMKRLIEGHPIGSALEYFNSRYAELSTDLTTEIDETDEATQNEVKLAGLWTANKDARNYMIIGDPAVKLVAADGTSSAAERSKVSELLSEPPVSGPSGEQVQPAATPSPQPVAAAVPVPQGVAPVYVDYGLGDTFRKAGSSLSDGLQTMVSKLSDFLGKALDDAASLEVSTYVSDDIESGKYEDGEFTNTKLRALTRVKIDGDTMVVVPESDGDVDADLWKIHLEMLQQAQASRAELVKTAVSAVSGLSNLLKP